MIHTVAHVVQLPRVEYRELDVSAWTRKPGLPLKPMQARALAAIQHVGGGFFPIGVGHGKTYIALLAGTVLGRTALVFAPPHTLAQMRGELDKLREHYCVTQEVRLISYGLLSSKNGRERVVEVLKGTDPRSCVFVFDEAHMLKNPKSTRVKRVEHLLQIAEGAPVVALSGTMTNRSITEFAHLARWCLREWSFVPDGRECQYWAQYIDVARGQDFIAPDRAAAEAIEPLWRFAGLQPSPLASFHEEQEISRRAFQLRMHTSGGVVSSGDEETGASLTIVTLRLDVPAEVEAALDLLDEGYAPDDTEVVEPAHRWLLGQTLSQGLWYELVWGDWATPQFFAERKAWWGWVRAEVERRGLESPSFVTEQAKRAHEAGENSAYARRWASWAPWANHPEPQRRTHWITDSVIEQTLDHRFGKKQPTIYWHLWEQVGRKLAQKGRFHFYGRSQTPANKAHTCTMSIRAQGEGLTLHSWARGLVVDVPTTGLAWEQLLGRSHRYGTEHDEVVYGVLQHTKALRRSFAQANVDARYIEQTKGHKQRLCYATKVARR